MLRLAVPLLLIFSPLICYAQLEHATLNWTELPPIPNELGVAGPLVGVHRDALIVAGGANFPTPVWKTEKVWYDEIYVLTRDDDRYSWKAAGKLDKAVAYSATVSTPDGVICMGGNDSRMVFDNVFALKWEEGEVKSVSYPALPQPCVYADATYLDGAVYVAGGQSSNAAGSELSNFWKLEINANDPMKSKWTELNSWEGPPRAHCLCVWQNNGYRDAVYLMSGRRQTDDLTEFFKDVWEYTPATDSWRRRADLPQCVMAGTAIGYGQSNLFVLGGDDGSLFAKTNDLKDSHPGFPQESFMYNTITDEWTSAGQSKANHVTTKAVMFDGQIVVPSGEVRPRVRSPKVWSIKPKSKPLAFGSVNYAILVAYLLAMAGVGVYFARKNKNTDDYFRGGKRIPWIAAGCSIYATMLSSLTYTGLPSKSFAQDWVLAVMNFMIPVVAFVAVYVALPFYRRIDATSAYEYLERRFNRAVRLFGSVSFTLYHLFRMAVVMSLTGLAIAVATPFDAAQSVCIIGVLSIIYCTMGGIEAVIWTDTIQTCVLLGGAVLAFLLLLSGIEGGWDGFLSVAQDADKFKMANFNMDVTSVQVAIWFIIIGSVAQNISAYTADQAVVQRYMTTETEALAARSIWMNAVLSIPTTLLFFGIGTALYAFYKANPAKLDPTMQTDQIFPLFIAREMPVGLAGLIVAGIFAAAQSTVSTSMNSTATTIVTDFVRTYFPSQPEKTYLRIAQALTLLFGVAGTGLGLVFIDPDIKSLFDTFIKIVGIFMGVLGGLFLLGALTRKANGTGALIGAFVGATFVVCLFFFTKVTFLLYTFSGILSCFVVGYAASLVVGAKATERDLLGLTIYTTKSLSQRRQS